MLNTKKSLVRVPVDEVQWLSEDTITPCADCWKIEGEKKDKKKLSDKIHLGDFVRRKNGTGRSAKVTRLHASRTGVIINVEYFYDGAHCTGEMYLDEVEIASKPRDWDKWMSQWVSETSGGRHINADGSEYWIGGVGSRGSRSRATPTWNEWVREKYPSDDERKKEKKEKKDSIDRGDLIREEVNRLKSDTGEKPAPKEPPKIKIRKPKEDW